MNNNQPSLAKWVKFPAIESKGGVLLMYQEGGKETEVPFAIKRVLVTKCTAGTGERGAHTHHASRQIFLAISGACTVILDDGTRKEEVRIDKPDMGLLMEPYVWHVMKEFADNTTTLAFFDSEYDEKDYIRNYDEFLQCLKK